MVAVLDRPLAGVRRVRKVLSELRFRERVRTLPWAMDHVVNDQGRPYDHAAYPHLGAPGGPFDAFDDPHVRTISLQWATRLGKTFGAHVCLAKTAATDPCPMMFASDVEKNAKEGMQRIYSTFHQKRQLNELLTKNEREQKQDLLEFLGGKIYAAWSRSVSTLADKNIKVGHGGEWDKWVHQSTSKEAHPHKLFDDRYKDYQSIRKVLYEGTPTEKGHSPIERKRVAGTNCKFHVPCRKCKTYQWLGFGKNAERVLVWERGEAGKQDPDVAYNTAHFRCAHCGEKSHDHDRAWMMRRGVWVPEGCQVDHAAALEVAERFLENPRGYEWKGWKNCPWIIGKPARDGQDASYQLSSLYALSLGWGDIAKEFVNSLIAKDLRNFVNQWLGETWESVERKQTWEELGERIIISIPRGTVPAGFSLLTMGIDKQQEIYVWAVKAWGPDRSSHTVDYGITEERDELLELLQRKWKLEVGGTAKIARGLMDCGYRPRDVHNFVEECKKLRLQVEACRGSDKPLDAYYVPKINSKKSSNPGRRVIWVDSQMTQEQIDHQIHTLKADDPGGLSLFKGSLAEHQDYLEQLLNEAIVPRIDNKNRVVETWQRIDEGIPNDYRDAERYAFVAMLRQTRGRKIKDQPAAKAAREPKVIRGNRSGIITNPSKTYKLTPTMNR